MCVGRISKGYAILIGGQRQLCQACLAEQQLELSGGLPDVFAEQLFSAWDVSVQRRMDDVGMT